MGQHGLRLFQLPIVIFTKSLVVIQKDFLVNQIYVGRNVPFSCWVVRLYSSN